MFHPSSTSVSSRSSLSTKLKAKYIEPFFCLQANVPSEWSARIFATKSSVSRIDNPDVGTLTNLTVREWWPWKHVGQEMGQQWTLEFRTLRLLTWKNSSLFFWSGHIIRMKNSGPYMNHLALSVIFLSVSLCLPLSLSFSPSLSVCLSVSRAVRSFWCGPALACPVWRMMRWRANLPSLSTLRFHTSQCQGYRWAVCVLPPVSILYWPLKTSLCGTKVVTYLA